MQLARERAAKGEAQEFASKAFRWRSNACLIWPFGCRINHGREVPVVGNGGKMVSVRRFVLDRRKEDCVPNEVIRTSCGNDRCVNVKHIVFTTRKAVVLETIAAGRQRAPAPQRGSDQYRSHPAELIEQVALATGSHKEICVRFGVSGSLVDRAKHGQHWSQRAKVTV